MKTSTTFRDLNRREKIRRQTTKEGVYDPKIKIINSPEDLLAIAEDYMRHVDANPMYVEDFIKSGKDSGKIVRMARQKPYTLSGLSVFAYRKGYPMLHNYFDNTHGAYEKFQPMCEVIRQMMYDQKFSGAAANVFNANIIARELGLTERSESTVKVEQPLFEISATPLQLEETDRELLGEYVDFDEYGR